MKPEETTEAIINPRWNCIDGSVCSDWARIIRPTLYGLFKGISETWFFVGVVAVQGLGCLCLEGGIELLLLMT